MKTLQNVAEYHELQAKILENTRTCLASLALPTGELEQDVQKHKEFALTCREAALKVNLVNATFL